MRFFYSVLLLTLIAGVAHADFTGTGDGNSFLDNDSVSSSIEVTGTTGTISGIEVTINSMEHSWLGDLTAVLDNGVTSVTLFERVGRVGGAGFGDNVDTFGDFTFSDDGMDSLWDASDNSGGLLDGTGFDFSTSGEDDIPTDLSDFFGQGKDGTWTLTISDAATGDTGQYAGWTLNIISSNEIPEPSTFGLLAGIAGLAVARRRR